MELTRKLQAEIRALHTRHGRRKLQCCCCEGLNAVTELFRAAPELVRYTLCTEEMLPRLPYCPQPVIITTLRELAELTDTVTPQGVLSVARQPDEPDAAEAPADPFILALDRIGDPGNFGTICRTALAAGLTEIWCTSGTVDPWGDKAIRSGLGAQFRLRLRTFPNLELLRSGAQTFEYDTVYLTDPHGGESCFEAPELFHRSVLVIGAESSGVGELAEARRVLIPMPGKFESLNAAQAATIFLFEHVRRQAAAAKGTKKC